MKTTLNEILKKRPCGMIGSAEGFGKLLRYLDKKKADDEPLEFKTILDSNEIEDAVWCLCVLIRRDYCLFQADIAEGVLHVFEKKYPLEEKYPDNDAPRKSIESIRKWHDGEIDDTELERCTVLSFDLARKYGFYSSAAFASMVTYPTTAIDSAALAVDAACFDGGSMDSGEGKWKEIEALFIKHFVSI